MKNDNFIYCLKVDRKRNKSFDYYYREDLEDIRTLLSILKSSYPNFLYSVLKVRSIPIHALYTLNVDEALFLDFKVHL